LTTTPAGVCFGESVGPPNLFPPDESFCQISLDASTGDVSAQQTFLLKPSCVVPPIEGRRLSFATSQTRKNHCTVWNIAHSFSRKVKKGRVISQAPRACTQHPNGWPVNLLISKGIRPQPTR
jgi:hypothetical protein